MPSTKSNSLPVEIEATFLDIDKDAVRDRLRAHGATLRQAEALMRRTVFDTGENSFARVRDELNRVTMSYKRQDDLSLSGTKEVCLEINDYNLGVAFLQACGLKPKSIQETYREEWNVGPVEVTIDTWPWLPPFVEIEGPSESAVAEVASLIGFRLADAIYGSVDQVYKVYYDVTSHDINYCPEIKFTDLPAWLAAKRRSA